MSPSELRRGEVSSSSEIMYDPRVLSALSGTISEPITTTSYKKGEEGKQVSVRLVESGSGQFGLTDLKDNKKWAGIFHHSVLTGRIAAHIAEAMDAGNAVNKKTLVDGMIVSHAGRRAWEEADHYRDAVSDAADKRITTNEAVGLRLIHGKVSPEAFSLVAGLAHGQSEFAAESAAGRQTLEYKVAIYVDHRSTDKYHQLHERMGDFLANNFFEDGTVDAAKREEIRSKVKVLIDRKKFQVRGDNSENPISIQEADRIVAEELGASEGSARLPREEFMHLLLQDAETEAVLEMVGVDLSPDTINALPMPKWEDDIRRKYVHVAGKEIAQVRNDQGTFDNYFAEGDWRRKYAEEINPAGPVAVTLFTSPPANG